MHKVDMVVNVNAAHHTPTDLKTQRTLPDWGWYSTTRGSQVPPTIACYAPHNAIKRNNKTSEVYVMDTGWQKPLRLTAEMSAYNGADT